MTDDIYTPSQRHWLRIAIVIALGLLLLYGISGYITALLGSMILYVLLRPAFHYLCQRWHFSRLLSAVVLMVLSLVVIVLPFLFLSILLINKVTYYVAHTGEIMELVQHAEDLTGLSLENKDTVQMFVQRGTTLIEQWVPSLVGSVLDLTIIVALLYFALYYMLVDEKTMIRGVRRYLPFEKRTRGRLEEELKNITYANVVGQGLISLVQGGLTGLGMWVLGYEEPLFWGTVAFFVSFIPVLGTPLVWGPVGLVAIAQGDTGAGLGLLLFGAIVVMNVDNVLRLVIGKRLGHVHPLITLGGVILGVPLFGILGLVIGPLLVDYFVVLMRAFARKNEEIKATPDYVTPELG